MSNEFGHKTVGLKLTQAEYESLLSHEADGQTTNDMLYFNGTYWIRATTAQIRTLLGVEATADIVLKSAFSSDNSILIASTASVPEALAIAASRIPARLASGGIVAATPAQILAILTGQAAAAFDWNGQKITSGSSYVLGTASLEAWLQSTSPGVNLVEVDGAGALVCPWRWIADKGVTVIEKGMGALGSEFSTQDEYINFNSNTATIIPSYGIYGRGLRNIVIAPQYWLTQADYQNGAGLGWDEYGGSGTTPGTPVAAERSLTIALLDRTTTLAAYASTSHATLPPTLADITFLDMITFTPNGTAPTMDFNSRPISNLVLGGTMTCGFQLISQFSFDQIGALSTPTYISAQNADNATTIFRARDNGVGLVEVARLQGAADPYMSFGGSQQWKFYYSGAVDFNNLTGVLRADAGAVSVDTDVTDIVTAADLTTAGKIEVATAAETTTGTDATRAVSPDGLAGSDYGKRPMLIKVIDDATALAIGDGKFIFVVPALINGWNLVGVEAHVTTVSSSGTPTYTIYNLTDSADMLSTAITIDANEYTSATAATPPVINGATDDVATGDRIEINKDVAGTGEKGDEVLLIFQLP